MKNLKLFAILLLLFSGCSEDFLEEKSPQDRYTEEAVWNDINLARTYLSKAYSDVQYGIGRGEMLGAMTDEMIIARGGSSKPYNSGVITSDNLGSNRGHLTWSNYGNIQRLNTFLVNIERVPENYEGSQLESIEEDVEILRGEALYLRAWEYNQLLRSYGGVPLISEPNELGDDFSGILRATFKETVNFIVADLGEAADLLGLKNSMEMGRANKEAALALKSRVTLFAASELTADGTAPNALVGYENPDREALWTAARDAAKAVIDLGTLQLADFGAPDREAVSENYFEFFAAHDLSSAEVIWGRMFLPNVGATHSQNRTTGPNGNSNFGRNGPMQQMVDSYQMIDGTDFFDHYTLNAEDEYVNLLSSEFLHENIYKKRDPRFYASILHDSAVWQPRFPNLADIDPLGIYDRRTRITIENGVVVNERFGLDTHQGPVDNWNANYAGYLLKKFQDRQTVGRDGNNQNVWIFLRYAEILLNYAEASLELGDEATAAEYINKIRIRAAMPDFTGDTREALHYERKIELFGEDVRWYDIRRWKKLEEVLDIQAAGIKIIEITENGETTTTWGRVNAQPANNPVQKLYWIPIAQEEIRRAPQLIQNPGY